MDVSSSPHHGPIHQFGCSCPTGRRRWAVVHGSLEDAEAKRAELRLRRRRGERTEPTRQRFAEYAWEWLDRQSCRDRTREIVERAVQRGDLPPGSDVELLSMLPLTLLQSWRAEHGRGPDDTAVERIVDQFYTPRHGRG